MKRCYSVVAATWDDSVASLLEASLGCAAPIPLPAAAVDDSCDAVLVPASDLEATLHAIRGLRERLPTIAIIAALPRLDDARWEALISAGADDFIALPFHPGELDARLQRALCCVRGGGHEHGNTASPSHLRKLIGRCPNFMREVARMPLLARCDSSVLICGETGTGKEIFAQALHYESARAAQPLVAVNCGAISAELIEDELFGHVRGAYTTAHAARNGLIREAEGGTLFLDDVDCLPLPAQAKLLRFLQEREYRCVGSNTVKHADVRVIAATNVDLAQCAQAGRFRQDLYFRLDVLSLQLPPLRERSEDIRLLALHFIDSFNHRLGRRIKGLTHCALGKLLAHDWPGNVRELQHVLERSLVLAKGPLLRGEDIDLRQPSQESAHADSFRVAKSRMVSQFERGFIERLLIRHAGNVTQAARTARKNRRAFFELMRKHHIDAERYRESAGQDISLQ